MERETVPSKRVCPVCNKCGSRKFKLIEKTGDKAFLQCLGCSRTLFV